MDRGGVAGLVRFLSVKDRKTNRHFRRPTRLGAMGAEVLSTPVSGGVKVVSINGLERRENLNAPGFKVIAARGCLRGALELPRR